MRQQLILRAIFASALLAVTSSGYAQINCAFCDQVNGSCDQSCYRCDFDYPDGSCPPQETHYMTCGDLGGGCIPSNCSPYWVDTSRELRGTYGVGYGVGCEHHRVEWVGHSDANRCNTNSSFWTTYSCDDSVDGWKTGVGANCCDCYPTNDFCCNNYHSC